STATSGLKQGFLGIVNTDLTSAGPGMGSADGIDIVTINGTVVANRVITASAVSFGRLMAGGATTGTTSLGPTGGRNHFTRVTVLGTAVAADTNGVAINAGADTLFNAANKTGARVLSANFTTTGAITGAAHFAMQGEGLAGESVVNNGVSYTATALANR